MTFFPLGHVVHNWEIKVKKKLEKTTSRYGFDFEQIFDILNYRIAWILDLHSFYAGVDLAFSTKFESSQQKNI